MTRRRRWLLACLPLCLIANAAGQQTTPTFKAVTEAVTVPVSVRDKGRPVPALTAADFLLTDNGVEQQIAALSLESVPIDATVVLDTSGSVTGSTLNRFKVDVQAISNELKPTDRVRLITFAESASDVFGLQSAGTPLPLDSITSGGITQVYSALTAALITVSTSDRPQLILAFTDGRDSDSFEDADHLTSVAAHSNAALYIVLAESSSDAEERTVPENVGGSVVTHVGHGAFAGGPNRTALRVAAERTGGAVYDLQPSESLPTVFKKLLDDFRTGYVLAYTPAGVTRLGWHDLQVRCRNTSYTIRTREGYNGSR